MALQDLGAAGLSSSSAEMASKGEVGLDIDVSRVPLREAGMEPWEIMISESQERMLCVTDPDTVERVLAICAKWEVHGTVIGSVTSDRVLRVLDGDAVVGEMPVEALVDDCPLYDLTPERPAAGLYPAPVRVLEHDVSDPGVTLLALLASPNIASRLPLFQQYDCIVQSRTVRRPEQCDAAVLAMPGGGAIAVSIDGSGRRVACDPYTGTVEAVLECTANLACAGAEPLGLTNCLNFGNPEKPHVAWQLTESIRGLADACRALDVPVVGGNVSLYNESGGGPIYPTPVIGMVGELPAPERAGRTGFLREGDAIGFAGPFDPAHPRLRAREAPRRRAAVVAAAGRHRIAARGAGGDPRRCPLGRPAQRARRRRGRLPRRGRRVLPRRRGRRRARARADGRRARARAVRRVPGPWLRRVGHAARARPLAQHVAVDRLGTVGGDALDVTAGDDVHITVTLAQLREAHAALAPLFP